MVGDLEISNNTKRWVSIYLTIQCRSNWVMGQTILFVFVMMSFYTIVDWLAPLFLTPYCEVAQLCSWYLKQIETHQRSATDMWKKAGTIALTWMFQPEIFQWTKKKQKFFLLIRQYSLTNMTVLTYCNGKLIAVCQNCVLAVPCHSNWTHDGRLLYPQQSMVSVVIFC